MTKYTVHSMKRVNSRVINDLCMHHVGRGSPISGLHDTTETSQVGYKWFHAWLSTLWVCSTIHETTCIPHVKDVYWHLIVGGGVGG